MRLSQTMNGLIRFFGITLLVVGLAACGGESADTSAAADQDPSGLTAAQLENGVGPITTISLNAIDSQLASEGEGVFTMKCSACHKMAERYVGPPLGDVTDLRTPAFIMNMILNPEEMIQKHPEVKKMLGQYMTPMPNQHLTEDEARAVLEYLRTQASS